MTLVSNAATLWPYLILARRWYAVCSPNVPLTLTLDDSELRACRQLPTASTSAHIAPLLVGCTVLTVSKASTGYLSTSLCIHEVTSLSLRGTLIASEELDASILLLPKYLRFAPLH